MVVTKKALLEQIAQYEAQRQQFVANINACNGAIECCQYWLAAIAEEESKATTTPEGPPLEVIK